MACKCIRCCEECGESDDGHDIYCKKNPPPNGYCGICETNWGQPTPCGIELDNPEWNCPDTINLSVIIPSGTMTERGFDCCEFDSAPISLSLPLAIYDSPFGNEPDNMRCNWSHNYVDLCESYDTDDFLPYYTNAVFSQQGSPWGIHCCENGNCTGWCGDACCTGTRDPVATIRAVACLEGKHISSNVHSSGVLSCDPAQCVTSTDPCEYTVTYETCAGNTADEIHKVFSAIRSAKVKATLQFLTPQSMPYECQESCLKAPISQGAVWELVVTYSVGSNFLVWTDGNYVRELYKNCDPGGGSYPAWETQGFSFILPYGAGGKIGKWHWYWSCEQCCCPFNPDCPECFWECAGGTIQNEGCGEECSQLDFAGMLQPQVSIS